MKSIRILSRIIPLSLLMSLHVQAVPELKTKDELHSAVKGAKKIAVKIGAEWCGACKISEKPFSNAAAKHPDVKAVSIDADNREFRKFIRMFQVEGLPSMVYIRKVVTTDPDYEDIAKMVGVDDKSTIVLTRKEVGSRNEDEFTKSFAALAPSVPKPASAEKPAESVAAQPKVVREEPQEETAPMTKKRKRWGSRRKQRQQEYAREMAEMGFPMES